jgi:hypothetical protein
MRVNTFMQPAETDAIDEEATGNIAGRIFPK